MEIDVATSRAINEGDPERDYCNEVTVMTLLVSWNVNPRIFCSRNSWKIVHNLEAKKVNSSLGFHPAIGRAPFSICPYTITTYCTITQFRRVSVSRPRPVVCHWYKLTKHIKVYPTVAFVIGTINLDKGVMSWIVMFLNFPITWLPWRTVVP